MSVEITVDIQTRTIGNEEVSQLETLWADCFPGAEPLPRPQYIRWLRKHSIDIVRFSFMRAAERYEREGARMSVLHLIRYVSAIQNRTAEETL